MAAAQHFLSNLLIHWSRYELSGELPLLDEVGGGVPLSASATPRVLVSNVGDLSAVHRALEEGPLDRIPVAAGSHFVQLVQLPAGPLVVCSGIDSTSTLYAVYSLMEALGIRFRNHGDVIPRGGHGHGLASLLAQIHVTVPEQRVWQTPNMALRGSQPFADFPAGPDWWGVEEYKHFFEQMAKSKSNFLGLHTYHNEPTVWQDSTDPSHFNATTGNITRVQTYPQSQYTYTTTLGGWGQNRTAAGWTGTPGPTSEYLYGSAQMYHEDCYGTPAVMGDPEICPNPTSENAQARIFNNVAAMLKDAFGFSRDHLGFQTAVGCALACVETAFFQYHQLSSECTQWNFSKHTRCHLLVVGLKHRGPPSSVHRHTAAAVWMTTNRLSCNRMRRCSNESCPATL